MKNTYNPLSYSTETTLKVLVTPELATELLQFNFKNRSAKPTKITRYARQMRRNTFYYNGDSLAFSRGDGRLLNGQNRLMACVEAGVGFTTNITFGVSPEAWPSYDCGEIRTGADTLKVDGEANSSTLASALKYVSDYMDGTMLSRRPYGNDEIQDLLEKHPRLRDSISPGRALHNVTIASLACAAHYLFSKVDAQKADMMFEQLKTGCGLQRGMPTHTLREYLIKVRADKESKPKPYVVFALFIKAFNALVNDQEVKRLSYVPSGEHKEEFPDIVGLPARRLGRRAMATV